MPLRGSRNIPIYCFYNSTNPRQKYWTISAGDPNIPAGYVDSQGSDGAQPEALKVYTAGINSGGFAPYGDLTTNPTWPNGILGGYGGGKAKG